MYLKPLDPSPLASESKLRHLGIPDNIRRDLLGKHIYDAVSTW
jgi:hypothetical protein